MACANCGVGSTLLTLCSPNYACNFQNSGPNKFSRNSQIFKDHKRPLYNGSLRKTNIRHGETSRRFELDMEPETAERAVESTSTLDR
jgi:hypothetical protein